MGDGHLDLWWSAADDLAAMVGADDAVDPIAEARTIPTGDDAA